MEKTFENFFLSEEMVSSKGTLPYTLILHTTSGYYRKEKTVGRGYTGVAVMRVHGKEQEAITC